MEGEKEGLLVSRRVQLSFNIPSFPFFPSCPRILCPPSLYLDLIFGAEETCEVEEDRGRQGAEEEGEEVGPAGVDALMQHQGIFLEGAELVFFVTQRCLKEGELLL